MHTRRPRWVKTGNTQSEEILSALLPKADSELRQPLPLFSKALLT
jgi:hypothetical protein